MALAEDTMNRLRENFQRLKKAYDEGNPEVCYVTNNGEQCSPLTVWEKGLIVLYYGITDPNNPVLYRNSFFSYYSSTEKKYEIKEEFVRKLVWYVALCYSKLNDDDGNRYTDPKTKETYYSYGKLSTSILTPDRFMNRTTKTDGLKKNEVKLTLNDYILAYGRAYDGAIQYMGNEEIYKKSEEDKKILQLISRVPVYRCTDSSLVSPDHKTTRNKCNVYVYDVLFCTLCVLIQIIKPNQDVVPNLHNLMRETRVLSSFFRPENVYPLYTALYGILKKEGLPYHRSSTPTKTPTIISTGNEKELKSFGYIDFLCQSVRFELSDEDKKDEEKVELMTRIWTDLHHVELLCKCDSYDDAIFSSISAHATMTSVKKYTNIQPNTNWKDKRKRKFSVKHNGKNITLEGMSEATDDNHVIFISICDIIQKIIDLYVSKY